MKNPTSDEKVMAALAHASVLFAFFGPIGPTLIWAFQRNKSKYVQFHALQAMGYQATAFWVWFIGIFVIAFGGFFVVAIIEGIFIANNPSSTAPVFPFIMQPIIFLGIFGLWGIFFIFGIIGAILCMMNRNFSYPIIGGWLQKRLLINDSNESIEESELWEDNFVSAICHSTAILQLWGIIVPLIVWLSQKERSTKLHFQALQAGIYQLTAFIGYMLWNVIYMILFFVMFLGMLFLVPEGTSSNTTELSPIGGIIFVIFFIVMMGSVLIAILIYPLYLILALIASILTMRGKNFKYPILGSIIARRIASKPTENPQM